MKKQVTLTIAILALALSTLACQCGWLAPIQYKHSHKVLLGSGNMETQEKSFTGFDRVEASHVFQVKINQGEDFSVTVRMDDEVREFVQVTKQGNTLKLGLKPDHTYTFKNVTLEATVTMPELTGVSLSGASHAKVTGFMSARDLNLDISGTSSVEGDIEASTVICELSGSSTINLNGSADDLVVKASGGSIVKLSEFSAANADIEASGASTATVNVSGTLNANASGASRVYYVGEPTLGRVDTSGAASVGQK
ncbi:MAG: head GIN domain-containing protein [Anaerolineae bacterium]|jgi:hypothetical protein